jgi:hypothetical protein
LIQGSSEPWFVHGDRLEQHGAVRFEQPVAGAEEPVIMVETHGLEHLDAYDLVEAAAQLTVVLEQKLNMQRKCAPAGSDFPDPILRLQLEFPANTIRQAQ